MKDQIPWIMITGFVCLFTGGSIGWVGGHFEGGKAMRLTAQREASLAGVGKYIVGETGEPVFALMECGKGEKK